VKHFELRGGCKSSNTYFTSFALGKLFLGCTPQQQQQR
jgi:hypothetical protein